MADLPAALIQPLATPDARAARSRADVARVAEEFEATFLASMLGVMFQGTTPEAPFSGGAGEETFRSFLTDAMAKSLAKAGGIGLADDLSRELLTLQGLEPA